MFLFSLLSLSLRVFCFSFFLSLKRVHSSEQFELQIRIYNAKSIFEDLNVAKEEFIRATVYVHKQKKIYLPKILHHYAKDMSLSMGSLLKVVSECLPEIQQKSIDRFPKSRPEKCVYWLEESSSFRYLIHKEIAETTWG